MQLITILFISLVSRAHAVYLCFTELNCQFQSPSEIISTETLQCCQIGAYSYATDIEGTNCTQCDFVLNITIIPTQEIYTASVLYSPNGGQFIQTFPVQIIPFYTAVASNAILPDSPPHDSLLDVSYSEGNGEAIEYSRIVHESGSLYAGLIDRDTYSNPSIPVSKFIPVVRNESYNGSIIVHAGYFFAKSQMELPYSFFVLECLECVNGGYPNQECSQCVCTDGFTGKLCQNVFNASSTVCSNMTCQNNGNCSITANDTIQCDCVTSFHGDFCQFDVDECLLETHNCTGASQCLNLYGGFSCICNEGVTGIKCDVIIEPCSVIFCTQHSSCSNQGNEAVCVCDGGYTGVACNTIISACDMSNCSVNTSVCIDSLPGSTEYTCICKSGYTGELCTLDIYECENEPCLNTETCINSFGGYDCVCEAEDCSVNLEEPGYGVVLGVLVAFILCVLLFGAVLIVIWVIFLVYRYLKKVRSRAKYMMIRKFEKERRHMKRSRKKLGKNSQVASDVENIEMKAVVFDNTQHRDLFGEDDIITTL